MNLFESINKNLKESTQETVNVRGQEISGIGFASNADGGKNYVLKTEQDKIDAERLGYEIYDMSALPDVVAHFDEYSFLNSWDLGNSYITQEETEYYDDGDDSNFLGNTMNMYESINNNLKETYLEPKFDNADSFYNKAQVDGDKLYSYDTLVAEIENGTPVIYAWSNTTGRHIKEWLLQNGFDAVDKKQMLTDYADTSLKETDDFLGNKTKEYTGSTLKEAGTMVTDYIDEATLDKYIKAHSIFGGFKNYELLDGMRILFTGEDGEALYRVSIDPEVVAEFILIDDREELLSETIPLKEGN